MLSDPAALSTVLLQRQHVNTDALLGSVTLPAHGRRVARANPIERRSGARYVS
ncbi:hypothetical protein [Mycobacterium lepromatosis]|nr:hypothetical protein [Mycobacterium lepromatosis]